MPTEGFTWHPKVRIDKYDADTVTRMEDRLGRPLRPEDFDGVGPDHIARSDGNMLTSAGAARLAALLLGESVQALTPTRTVVGVGNSSAAENAAQTDLQAAAGATNRWFQGADAGFPTRAANVLTVKSTFLAGDGNFTWNEWCVAIATAAPVASAVIATATTSGIMLNRKVDGTLGTKANGQVWVLTATLTGA